MTALAATGVAVRLGERQVLAGVDLGLPAGSVTLLAGRNGAGKSTLLRVLAGLLRADAGSVTLDGRPIDAWSPRQRARRVAYVPQEADSTFEFTGRELVAMGRHPHLRRFAGLGSEDIAAVDMALSRVDAAHFADRPVTTLSGGELRRIAVARALCTGAPVLLLDEPTANLDLEHSLRLGELLRALAAEGRTVAVASHDLNLLGPVADCLLLLHEGRIAASGPPTEVLAGDAVVAAFGVRAVAPSGFFPRAFRPPDQG